MLLETLAFTPSGRPVLGPGEVEKYLLDKVDLEFQGLGGLQGQLAEAYKGGYIILTNQRLIWVDAATSPSVGRSCQLLLKCVRGTQKRTQLALRPKVRLEVQVYTGAGQKPVGATDFHTSIGVFNLRCRGDAPDALKQHIDEARSALQASASASAPAGPAPSTSSAASSGAASSAQRQQQQQPLLPSTPLTAGLAARAGGGVSGGPGVDGVGGGKGADVSQPAVQPDPELLRQMVDMGFPLNKSARCLVATRNESVQQALDHLLAFGDQPGMDEPLPSAGQASSLTQQPHPPPYQQQALVPPVQAPQQLPYGMPPPVYPQYAQPGYPPYPSQQQAYYGQPGAASMMYPSVAPIGNPLVGNPYAMPGPPAYGGYPAPQYGGYPSHYQAAPVPAGQPGGYSSGSLAHQAAQALQGMQVSSQQQQQPPAGITAAASGAATAVTGPMPGSGAVSSSVGVAGIVRREHDKVEQSGRALESAFQDLHALMASAADMVALAQRFRGVMAAGQEPGSAGGDDADLLDQETQTQLIAMGITSPVTRETAGARYHHELARQLADFLMQPPPAGAGVGAGAAQAGGSGSSSSSAGGDSAKGPQSLLKRYGGMMALPDVYCLFNRARGTELVSPDDLLQAAKMFAALRLPLQLRSFPSGAVVIQGEELSDEHVCASIARLVAPRALQAGQDSSGPAYSSSPSQQQQQALGPAVSSSDVARALGVSIAVAAEQLLLAEARGVLCRDDGPEGLRFFRNFFKDIPLPPPGLPLACR